MIEILVIDLCALILAPELKARLLLSQADKDGLHLACFADLPRESVRRALRIKGYLQSFDSLFYTEMLAQMTSIELRSLANPNIALWLRTPDAVDYRLVLPLLSPRRRLLPKALRVPKQLDSDDIFEAGSEDL